MTLEGGWLAAGPQMITLPASCRSFAHATGTACPFLGANARTWIDPGAYRHVVQWGRPDGQKPSCATARGRDGARHEIAYCFASDKPWWPNRKVA